MLEGCLYPSKKILRMLTKNSETGSKYAYMNSRLKCKTYIVTNETWKDENKRNSIVLQVLQFDNF